MHMSVKNFIDHAIGQLVKFTSHMSKCHLVKLSHKLVDTLIDRPQFPIFNLINAIHLVYDKKAIHPKVNDLGAHCKGFFET